MPRKPRILTHTGVYHVIIRGNDKQNIFFTNKDRRFFLRKLEEYSKQLNIIVYSYCLLNNHVHLLI